MAFDVSVVKPRVTDPLGALLPVAVKLRVTESLSALLRLFE